MWGWLCVLMCYRIMYGIIYTFTKWCIFIVLSANLQTPLAPSQETFLSTLANPSSNMLNFSLSHRTVVWKEIFESLPRLQMFQESRKEIIKNISVTPLLTELLIYSDFSLPASSDHLGFWCLSCHSFMRRELGTLHIKCLWMHSLGRNPHYKIRLHKGHVCKVLACSRQEVCYGRLCWGGRNGYVDSWFFIRGGQRQRATSATKLERLSKRYGHSLELCSPHQAGMEHFKTVPLTKRKPGVKNHQASNPSFSREPTPPVPWPGGGPWKPKSTAWDHRGNKSMQVFHVSGQSRPGVHPGSVTASGGCSTRQWRRLGNAPPQCLHGAGRYRAERMAITMNHCRGFLLTWLHPKPCCLHVIWLLHPSLAVLSTRLLPQAQSPSYAQPPPACAPEWVTWFH